MKRAGLDDIKLVTYLEGGIGLGIKGGTRYIYIYVYIFAGLS